MTMGDDHGLERFVTAQAPVIDNVRAELAAGQKRSHWMWFIFPQIAGLGLSAMSQRYAIANLAEASAYLAHPVLGPRLRECVQLAMSARRPALSIFGLVDMQKFSSCLTLFALASGEPLFTDALAQFFGGEHDQGTMDILANA
jgi:uncharacterized protein (DUF1810 family)